MERNVSQPLELFYCYARKDRVLRDELDIHLAGLRRSGLITAWYDGAISPGTSWEQEIKTHLESARIILLLVSPDFLHSDYCYSTEMARAIERHHRKEARVIPILLRPADWASTSFSTLQMLPSNTIPVTRWPDRDEAFADVVKGIRRAVAELIPQGIATSHSSTQEIAPQFKQTMRRQAQNMVSSHSPQSLQQVNIPGARQQLPKKSQSVSTHGLHAKKGVQFLSFLFLFLEGILLLRFLLKLFGADPGNLFAGFLYALTDIILFPFANIFRPLLLAPRPNPIYLTVPLLEWSTLLAMILYGMIFWGILRGLGMNIFGRKQ